MVRLFLNPHDLDEFPMDKINGDRWGFTENSGNFFTEITLPESHNYPENRPGPKRNFLKDSANPSELWRGEVIPACWSVPATDVIKHDSWRRGINRVTVFLAKLVSHVSPKQISKHVFVGQLLK